MKWHCSLWFLFTLFGLLGACQPPVLKPVELLPSSPLQQTLVPPTKGGTLGQSLVPPTNGGTLGQNLVPESNGGTLGKGLVPESKGGTLGRFVLRGQIMAPAGFRVQADISPDSQPASIQAPAQLYRLQLRDPLTQELWLELTTDPQGRFEIGNLPVETLLKLEVVSANLEQVPLQLWFAQPANAAQTLIQRNLDLASTAEGLLLDALIRQGPALRQFAQAARSDRAKAAQANLVGLLQTSGLRRADITASSIFTEAKALFQTAFSDFAQSETPTVEPAVLLSPSPSPSASSASAATNSGSGGSSSQNGQMLIPHLNLIQIQNSALPAGLVAEFQGEGNGNETSGFYTGVLHTDVAFGPGLQGRAFALNGSQGGIEVTGMDFAKKDYAVEVWFRTDFKQLQTLLKALPGFELQVLASGQVAFGHQPPALITSSAQVNDNRWHQAVASRQGNQESLFLDGHLVQSRSSVLADLNTAVNLQIGYQSTPSQQPFKGLIDQLRVYQRPLTETEVKALFSRRSLRLIGTHFVADPAQNKVSANGVPLDVFSASTTEVQAWVPDSLSGALAVELESGGIKDYPKTVQTWPLRVDQLSRSLLLTGDSLTVTGAGFDAATVARLSGVQGTVQNVNSLSLTVPVPPGLVMPGPLQLNNGGDTLMGPWLSPMPALPIAWWRAEGNAQDSLGAYPGSLQGAVQFVPGKVGQAFSLQAGAHVDLGLINALQGDFTWTGWFRTAVLPLQQTLISATQAGLPGLQVAQKNSQMGFLHRFPYDPVGGTETLAGTLLNGEWHHFAVAKNSLFQTLYIDGKSVDASDNASQFNSALQVLLGRIAPGDSSADFQGALDEICLFNQELSSAQIEQIYQYTR